MLNVLRTCSTPHLLIEKMDLFMDPKTDHLGNKKNDFLKKLLLEKAISLATLLNLI